MLRMILHFSHKRAQMHISHPGLSRVRFITSIISVESLTGTQVGHVQKNVLEVLYSYILQTHTQSYDYAEIQR